MIQKTISGEQPVQILAHSVAFGPSAEGYTLHYSADGVNFTPYTEATPANETLMVNGLPKGVFLKLVGNASDVVVNF